MQSYNFSNPIELNRYLYTANNPINAADPTGNQAFVEYSTADSTADEEGAALEPVGEEFASETEELVEETTEGLYCSFSADTKVATKDGEKSISEIKIGDYVLAWDWKTGKISFHAITNKLEHEDPVIVHLVIDDEKIKTTPEHPFYTEEKGWVNAGDLQEGMHIRNADGKYGVVNSVKTEKSTQRMYNLTVKDAHTFYVGEGQWLVHNRCSASDIRKIEKHLSRSLFVEDDSNIAMIDRLKEGYWTSWDQNFATHELLESRLMDSLIESGMDEQSAYDIAHLQVLQMQGITWGPGYEAYLYHPEIIERFPSLFSFAAQALSKILSGL